MAFGFFIGHCMDEERNGNREHWVNGESVISVRSKKAVMAKKRKKNGKKRREKSGGTGGKKEERGGRKEVNGVGEEKRDEKVVAVGDSERYERNKKSENLKFRR